jgi:hypothetical protein
MNKPSPVLPIAHAGLKIMIILNWVMAAFILALLFAAPTREWIIKSLDLSGSPDAERVVWSFRMIAALGLVSVPFNYVVLKRLLAIVDSVRDGNPFVAVNASRLQTIAWCMAAVQILSMSIGALGKSISTPEHPVQLGAGFSVNSWLAVLLTFVLARVFAEGTRMREDLDGTV